MPSQYPKIQTAINSADSGDTIQVSSGTYHEKLYIIDRQNLNISGAGKNQTKVLNNYSPADDVPSIYLENSYGIQISGMEFEGGDTAIVVTGDSEVEVRSSSIHDFHNVGIFIGEIPCAPLPPGSLSVPKCYMNNREKYVDSSRLGLYNTDVEENGVHGSSGTGLVFFPGSSGSIQGSSINKNKLTGVFVWGAQVDIADSEFKQNVEHALEYRQYPSPKKKKGFILRAGGNLSGNTIKKSKHLTGGFLGGGMVTQAADMILAGNLIEENASWGISASNGSSMILSGNTIINNGEAGFIVQKKSRAELLSGNTISGNGYEGLVVQGKGKTIVDSSIIQYNGRCGVLAQKKSEVHIREAYLRGNGTSAGYWGGVVFTRKAWGTVTGSEIKDHDNGPGVHYYGGPHEIFVEDSTISGNNRSGVVFDGSSAVGTALRNSYSNNNPMNLDCPNGGRAYLGSENITKVGSGCSTPAGKFVTIPANTAVSLAASDMVGQGQTFSNTFVSSLPVSVGKTMAGPNGVAGSAASPETSKKWHLPGGSTQNGEETRLIIYNPGTGKSKVKITYYPEWGSPTTITKRLKKYKRKVIDASAIIGSGTSFSTYVKGKKAVVAEQQVLNNGSKCNSLGISPSSESWHFPYGEIDQDVESVIAVHNNEDGTAYITFTYFFESGGPLVRNHQVDPKSGAVFHASADLDQHSGSFALELASSQPVAASIMVTRAGSLEGTRGASETASQWHLPRGTTLNGGETYIHLANSEPTSVQVTLDFHVGIPGSEIVTAPLDLPGGARLTLPASDYVPREEEFGVTVNADGPVVAGETTSETPTEMSSDTGIEEPGYRWYLPYGQTTDGDETVHHIYNQNSNPATIRLFFH